MDRLSVWVRARVRLAAAAALFLAGAGTASALPVTWTLHDVAFVDGGTASGWFVYDKDASLYLLASWSITVAGGDTTTFPPMTYDPTTSRGYYSPETVTWLGAYFNVKDSDRSLRFGTATVLDDAGGTMALLTGNGGGAECFNCDPARLYASGELIGTAVTSAAQTTFTARNAGSFDITTLGLAGSTLTVAGELPSGVTFTDNGDGTATLAGTAAAGTAGDYPLTITVGIPDVGPGAQQAFVLTIEAAPIPPSIPVPTLGLFGLLAGILGLLAVAWRRLRDPAARARS